MEIRNIAIIAHVDHGKTTLTDALLTQTGAEKVGVSTDSNDLEKERGITIYAKNASVLYKDTKINIVDTPGHADFGSEVERVLRSIDSVLLVVDAAEGPMPQTKFVLKKSLELGLKPILILNKIDKPAADVEKAKEDVYELFLDLGATDEQLDFTTLYAIGRDGVAKRSMAEDAKDLSPILDAILTEVPSQSSDALTQAPLRGQVFNLAYDDFLGRLGVVRVYEGTIRDKQKVFVVDGAGNRFEGKITKLFAFEGLHRTEVSEAGAGDIVMVAGLPDVYIGQTLLDTADGVALPDITIDEPTISLYMFINESPFAGREGTFVTARQIQERLKKELEINVGLRVDFEDMARIKVYGRGELHLAVLLENMRREGFEVAVSQPEVIFKEEAGKRLEPFEEVHILVPEDFSGTVIGTLSKRRGVLQNMVPDSTGVKISFEIPTRGLLGYRNEFVVDTKGEGILAAKFSHFGPYAGAVQKTESGSMTSMATGKALAFALANLQERGTLYIGPTTEVYEGMVIGSTANGTDMTVNPTKGKQLTNMRAAGSDENVKLAPPLDLTLEKALDVMREDEFVEVTPKSVRIRKQYLKESERAKHKRA